MSDVESCTCETKTVGSYPTEVVAVQTLCCNRDMNPSSNGIGDTYAGETDSLRLNHAFMRSPGNARLFANRHCYRCGVISAETRGKSRHNQQAALRAYHPLWAVATVKLDFDLPARP